MKSGEKNSNKELYNQLRKLSWDQLWNDEARRFDAASPQEREKRVAVVRAVGVVFSESGDRQRTEEVKRWLLALLQDPSEKIRRYAMTALPKTGGGAGEEARLLSLLRTTQVDRERQYAARALEKIGGAATLEAMKGAGGALPSPTEQKIKASVARRQSPSAVRLNGVLSDFAGLRIHLRGRRGLEEIVRDEVQEFISTHGEFRVGDVSEGLVALTPVAAFSLADIYALRCFGTVGFAPGGPSGSNYAQSIEGLASIIASSESRRVLQTFTKGTIRYRLNFVAKGHQRSAVRLLASRVYALSPEILNDARNVTWTLDIFPGAHGNSIELRPNLTPDPRFYYRRRDVPASSHPQVAASMARLAGKVENEIVWDPFCGSGAELIERALLGGVRAIHGTDLSAEAIAIARENLAAAKTGPIEAHFASCDFRNYAATGKLKPNGATLIITNPPLGMRVPVKNLHQLIAGLFDVAATILRPGGRLVFANPLSPEKPPPPFQMLSRQAVDFGGFDCRLEKYVKH